MDRSRFETWMSTLSGHNYAVLKDENLRIRVNGTGNWFLKSGEFTTWSETPSSILYCPGIPGAGKSVMVSAISNHLIESGASAVAYIHYSSDAKDQMQGNVLASLLEQFTRVHGLSQEAEALLQPYQVRKERPLDSDLLKCLRIVISGIASPAYILIDGVDESPREAGKFFDEAACGSILGLCLVTQTRILVTSRPNDRVESFIRDRAKGVNLFSLAISPTAQELRTYLLSKLIPESDDSDMEARNLGEYKVKCIEKMVKVCSGM